MRGMIIVTGASRGIGFAIASKLLQADYSVHMIARDREALQQAVRNLPGEVTYSSVDLSSRLQINQFVDEWDEQLYAIVNNAGIWAEERIDEPDSGIWDPIIRLNLEGTYFLVKGLQEWIVDGGRIVTISSQLGTKGRAGFGAYSASKHALIGLTRCWALELGGRGITVNAICPGWINTESNIKEIGEQAKEKGITVAARISQITEHLSLGRFIEPEEVASLVAFIVGRESSGITGQVYGVM
ncbi:MAG: SDR family NAD(P)-dependent oxidoreductase [Candidatus Thorarchaeota archaeon]|jgi:NAD(P)-dependent dehydrogenase (short-subunit alcohol dehydrogenase family)